VVQENRDSADIYFRGACMFIQIKAQEQFQYLNTSMGFSVQWGGPTGAQSALPSTSLKNDQLQLSPTSQMAMQYGMQDMNFSAGWTKMKFDSAGDLSAMLSHSINYSQQIETLNLDFTFTAESLGISAEDFKSFGNQPILMRFDISQSMIDYNRETTLTVQQTQRTAGEVIKDIATALKDVFRQKGDETVKVILDKEAFEALLGDARASELIGHIVALIGIINRMRLHGGPRNYYEIFVSGKGKPVVTYEDKVDVKIKSTQVNIQLTVLPPAEKKAGEAIPSKDIETVETQSGANSSA
jgi:hypothetical protein